MHVCVCIHTYINTHTHTNTNTHKHTQPADWARLPHHPPPNWHAPTSHALAHPECVIACVTHDPKCRTHDCVCDKWQMADGMCQTTSKGKTKTCHLK